MTTLSSINKRRLQKGFPSQIVALQKSLEVGIHGLAFGSGGDRSFMCSWMCLLALIARTERNRISRGVGQRVDNFFHRIRRPVVVTTDGSSVFMNSLMYHPYFQKIFFPTDWQIEKLTQNILEWLYNLDNCPFNVLYQSDCTIQNTQKLQECNVKRLSEIPIPWSDFVEARQWGNYLPSGESVATNIEWLLVSSLLCSSKLTSKIQYNLAQSSSELPLFIPVLSTLTYRANTNRQVTTDIPVLVDQIKLEYQIPKPDAETDTNKPTTPEPIEPDTTTQFDRESYKVDTLIAKQRIQEAVNAIYTDIKSYSVASSAFLGGLTCPQYTGTDLETPESSLVHNLGVPIYLANQKDTELTLCGGTYVDKSGVVSTVRRLQQSRSYNKDTSHTILAFNFPPMDSETQRGVSIDLMSLFGCKFADPLQPTSPLNQSEQIFQHRHSQDPEQLAKALSQDTYKQGSVGIYHCDHLITIDRPEFGITAGQCINLIFVTTYCPVSDFVSPSNFSSYYQYGVDIYRDLTKLISRGNTNIF